MKIVLIGSDRSVRIREASQYLITKYLPGFCPIYLSYNGILEKWSSYLGGFLSYLTDDKIILGLDDFLVEEKINLVTFYDALQEMKMNKEIVCVKLCYNTPEEFSQYPVSTQFSIWDRKYLIWMLRQTTNPWLFETEGSKLLNKEVLLRPCIQYHGNSALSHKWPGVNLGNLKDEDVYYLRQNNLI